MIQNSSDALRARILLENRTEDWGQISISYSEEENKKWIEVKDNGIGMSLEVIKSYLFEFGSSYWDSDLLLEEYPSLSGKKFTISLWEDGPITFHFKHEGEVVLSE